MVTDEINKNKEKYFPVQFKKNVRGQTIASTYAEKQQQILNIFGSQMSGIFISGQWQQFQTLDNGIGNFQFLAEYPADLSQ